jgi:hypothetical protein
LKKWVPSHDRARPPDHLHFLEQRPFDIELLDDGFENPVDGAKAAKVRVETARRDQSGCVRGKKRIGLEAACAFQPVACKLGSDVEQQHMCARVGKVRGDLRAHRARAEYCDRLNRRHPGHVTMRDLPKN